MKHRVDEPRRIEIHDQMAASAVAGFAIGSSHSHPAAAALPWIRWQAYLAASVLVIAIYFELSGPAQAICYELFGASSAVAILVGVRRYRPSHAGLWVLIAAGLGMLVVADLILNAYENWFGTTQPFPSAADVFFLAGSAVIVASLAAVVHRRTPVGDHGSFIDATIIAIGVGVLSWTYLMVPYAKDPTLTLLQRLVSISYPLIDVLLLAGLARLLFVSAGRSMALYFISIAVCATMAADVIYAELVLRGLYHRGNAIDALWLLWYAFWGAAALHPSMRTLAAPAQEQPRLLTGRRLLLLTASAVLVPAVGLLQWASDSRVDAPVIAGFSAILFLLVLIRMSGLVRGLESARETLEKAVQREQTLQKVAAALGGAADRRAIYFAALNAAQALAGDEAPVWIASGANDGLRIVAGLDHGKSRAAGERISLDALPSGAIAQLAARRASVIEHVDCPTLWGTFGRHSSAGFALIAPLFLQHERSGLIAMAVETPPEKGLVDGLEALGSQVTLALERDALAEDLLMRKSEERFRSLVRHASDLIFVVARDGIVAYVSPSVERVVGYRSDELIGTNVFALFHAGERDRVRHFRNEIVSRSGSTAMVELQMIHRDGSRRVVEAIGNNLLEDPSVNGIVINARDITERKSAEQQLAYQAFHDPLTGLPNRARFMDRLEHAVARSARRREGVAILFLDLDRFKVVNDSLGHEVGDQLLVETGRRLSESIRPGDTVARLGGDEFTILLEDVLDVDQASAAADRLFTQFQQPISINGRDVFVSLSIGIALSRGRQSRPADLLREADIAMYQVKRHGGAGHAVFDAEMGRDAMERLELETDLRRAIERDELRVYFQPEVELSTGRITSMEALARWQHPERGLMHPADFIPLAEETGLIIPLGRWVLWEACRQSVAWEQIHGAEAPSINVNLSVRQFQHPGVVDEVAAILCETGLNPRRLSLEITETVVMEDAESNNDTLQRMKELGVQLAIDDFGSGYSSFSYLKRFPMDILKIDRAFVAGLDRDLEDPAIIRAIMSLADTLRMQVVAEGVETRGQVVQLQLLGCHLAQGFHFAKPMTADDASALLEGRMVLGEQDAFLAASA